EYILGPEDLSVFVVTSDTLIYAQMAINREHLRTMLADLSPIFQKAKEQNRQQIFNAQLADFSIPPAYALYEVLVKPIASWLQDATELIIVPDDLLFYLPFEMLVVDTAKVETMYDFENARFLLENFDISYVSSASLLNPNLQRAGNPGKGLLAIGNPDFGSKAGESPPDKLLTLKGSYPDDTVRGETLLFPLPKSETEVKAIGKELSRSQNCIFTGDRATEENFKREAEDYSILHLATHFLTDDNQPLYSKIALAQNKSAIEDGYLQTYEVFNMRLNADLVVLSACNTGLGKLRRGEGMIGIARAFLFAGVPSLVVSLWNVNDESTSMIMKNFYKHLKAGLNNKQALRLAKLDYIKSSQNYGKDPFYWAPFILIGDWHPVQLPTRSSHFTWFMTLVIILILLSTTWIIKNRLRFSSK
ncbi:MAG: CHAT domain-containing protein, partial [bacterium]